MTNSRDELIWMAGFFDGEGCVSIGKQKASYRKGSTGEKVPSPCQWTYVLQVALSQKHPTPLEVFKRRFGGHLYEYQLHGVKYWRWCIGSKNAIVLIKELLPYLLVKRPIAELGIRFHEQMTAWNKEHGRTGYPAEIAIAREAFYLEARALNARNRTNNRAPKYEGPRTAQTVN